MRIALALILLAVCASCAATNVGGGLPMAATESLSSRRTAVALDATAAPAISAADTVRLEWTMPTQTADGRPLSTAPLDWQVAYSTQSRTYVAHRWVILTVPDSAAFWWPTVRVEAAPIPVASGVARPGERVEWVALPVTAGHWPFSWWVRTRQRSEGVWSQWSNPVTRANND